MREPVTVISSSVPDCWVCDCCCAAARCTGSTAVAKASATQAESRLMDGCATRPRGPSAAIDARAKECGRESSLIFAFIVPPLEMTQLELSDYGFVATG